MTEPSKNSNESTSRWIKVVLFLSLALNLLVVGLVGGALLRHGPGGRTDTVHSSPLSDLGYGPFGFALSPSDRQKIGRSWAEKSGDLRANRDEVRAQFVTLLDLLRETPFEIKAVQEIVENQRIKLSERQIIGQKLLLERIDAMSDEERMAFARRLEKSLKRPFRRTK